MTVLIWKEYQVPMWEPYIAGVRKYQLPLSRIELGSSSALPIELKEISYRASRRNSYIDTGDICLYQVLCLVFLIFLPLLSYTSTTFASFRTDPKFLFHCCSPRLTFFFQSFIQLDNPHPKTTTYNNMQENKITSVKMTCLHFLQVLSHQRNHCS